MPADSCDVVVTAESTIPSAHPSDREFCCKQAGTPVTHQPPRSGSLGPARGPKSARPSDSPSLGAWGTDRPLSPAGILARATPPVQHSADHAPLRRAIPLDPAPKRDVIFHISPHGSWAAWRHTAPRRGCHAGRQPARGARSDNIVQPVHQDFLAPGPLGCWGEAFGNRSAPAVAECLL